MDHYVLDLGDAEMVDALDKIAVYVAGVKSAIILHKLRIQTDAPIHTYTYGFPNDHQFMLAQKISEHYECLWTRIGIHEVLPWYKKVQSHFNSHILNICPFFLAQAASENKLLNCYVGEGVDNHVYQVLHKAFSLNLHLVKFGKGREALINEYNSVIPEWILQVQHRSPMPNPFMLWQRELYRLYPDEEPSTQKQIWALLEQYAKTQLPDKKNDCCGRYSSNICR